MNRKSFLKQSLGAVALMAVALISPATSLADTSKQVVVQSADEPEEQVFMAVEQSAEFPGGMSKLMRWLADNIRYPESAQQNDIQGRVIVRFIIDKEGNVSNPQVMKGVDKALDEEAIRVVNTLPKWIPAKNNGEVVSSYYVLPVSFKLTVPATK